MSIALMTAAWRLNMPASRKMILLAMCDWANDQGSSCHPSIKALATRASISERQAKRVVHDLIDEGWVAVVGNDSGGAPGQTRQYQLNVRAIETGDMGVTGDNLSRVTNEAPRRVTSMTRRVTSATETGDMGVTQTTIQPPVKASISRASANKREPVQILHQFDFGSWPSIPSEQVFSDWLALRKKKRADVSETVIRAMGAELHRAAAKGYAVDEALATCVLRGWQGLEAKWLDPKTGGNHAADRNDHRESLAERAERLYAEGEAREAAIAAEQRELGHGW